MTVPDTGSTPLRKVSKMDYEVAVIGSGSAGKEAALLAAKEGHRVAVIEKETLGGTCYHRGCFAIRTLRAQGRAGCANKNHPRLPRHWRLDCGGGESLLDDVETKHPARTT